MPDHSAHRGFMYFIKKDLRVFISTFTRAVLSADIGLLSVLWGYAFSTSCVFFFCQNKRSFADLILPLDTIQSDISLLGLETIQNFLLA